MARLTLHPMLRASKKIAVSAICSGIACASIFAAGNRDKELDLRMARITQPSVTIVGGSGVGGGIGSQGLAGADPVTLAVVSYDLSACRQGYIEVTSQIENTQGEAVKLPWNPDGAAVIKPGNVRQFRFRDLAISVIQQNDRPEIVKSEGSVFLFGAGSAGNSEIALQPHESAIIRNMRVYGSAENLCTGRFFVTAVLSADNLVKTDHGYVLHSRPLWRVRSK